MSPNATLAAVLRACADHLEAEQASPARRVAIESAPVMLTPEQACALVSGKDDAGRPRISERTLASRTKGQPFRRVMGRKVTYERAGLERWLRSRQ